MSDDDDDDGVEHDDGAVARPPAMRTCHRAVQHSVLTLLTVTLNDSLMSVLQ